MHPTTSPRGLRDRLTRSQQGTGSRPAWTGYRGPATRSGTIGRIAFITEALDDAIVSDDAIRVRIANPALRAYVYAFLQSKLAQDQMRINEYGAIQQHLEPEHVSNLMIPIPDGWSSVTDVVARSRAVFESKEQLDLAQLTLRGSFENLFEVLAT